METKRVALVTGASSGIGEDTVKRLLGAGFAVYAGARRVDRMQSLGQAGARVLALDVTDDRSMSAAVDTILQETGRIDVLVNNAGYGSYGSVEDVPIEEGRRQFEVNLFGLARLTQLVLPTMRTQRSGRIVNITSIGGKIGEPFGAWYHATKFAVEGFSDSLRMELHGFGVDVIIIEPGAIRTEWGEIAREGLLRHSGDGAYRDGARQHAAMFTSTYESRLPSSPDVVARTIVKSVQAARPRTRYAVGGGAHLVLFLRRWLSDRGFDAAMRMFSKQAKAPA